MRVGGVWFYNNQTLSTPTNVLHAPLCHVPAFWLRPALERPIPHPLHLPALVSLAGVQPSPPLADYVVWYGLPLVEGGCSPTHTDKMVAVGSEVAAGDSAAGTGR